MGNRMEVTKAIFGEVSVNSRKEDIRGKINTKTF